jgi:hypothetical protein
LKVIRPVGRNDAERVVVLFEGHGCACVDVSEVQELKQSVFGGALVVDQVRRSQDEPSLLPCLDVYIYTITIQMGERPAQRHGRDAGIQSPLTFRRSPFFHRYPDLMIVSSLDLR